jgi:divinyl chlorophyllide a 8-vinyl-reductase
MDSLRATAFAEKVDVVVSCLASRTGGIQDSWDIDYQATLNCLEAARAQGAKHFVLLSAICVQKPLLTFQQAKLKFEAALQAAGDISYSIVRPTAFMKSLAGQVESCKGGGPYVMFGDGQLASCKPISEPDLASFMADCIREPASWDKVLPIGGPGEALSALQQGNMLFEVLGQEPRFIRVPVALFDAIIGFLDFLASLFANLKDTAEFGRIGKYYAVESMLVMDPATGRYDADATPSYGKDTLRSFFEKVAKEGMAGQELGDAAVFGQK